MPPTKNSMEWYIKLFRKIEDWWWYTDTPTKCLFLHLLIKANIRDTSFRWIPIKKWSLITGRLKLSQETWLSEQQIRTSLDKLKSTNEITIKSTNSFSFITIQNWESYQDKSTNESTNEQPTDNQRITTGGEGKKERRKEDTGDFDSFWSSYSKKVDKAKAQIAYSKVAKEHDAIMQGLQKFNLFHKQKWTERQFIMWPAVFLNGRRWEDELDVKTVPKQKYNPLSVW